MAVTIYWRWFKVHDPIDIRTYDIFESLKMYLDDIKWKGLRCYFSPLSMANQGHIRSCKYEAEWGSWMNMEIFASLQKGIVPWNNRQWGIAWYNHPPRMEVYHAGRGGQDWLLHDRRNDHPERDGPGFRPQKNIALCVVKISSETLGKFGIWQKSLVVSIFFCNISTTKTLLLHRNCYRKKPCDKQEANCGYTQTLGANNGCNIH